MIKLEVLSLLSKHSSERETRGEFYVLAYSLEFLVISFIFMNSPISLKDLGVWLYDLATSLKLENDD